MNAKTEKSNYRDIKDIAELGNDFGKKSGEA